MGREGVGAALVGSHLRHLFLRRKNAPLSFFHQLNPRENEIPSVVAFDFCSGLSNISFLTGSWVSHFGRTGETESIYGMRARDEKRAGTDGPLYPTLRLLRQAARLQYYPRVAVRRQIIPELHSSCHFLTLCSE